jgi:hypothetical protein
MAWERILQQIERDFSLAEVVHRLLFQTDGGGPLNFLIDNIDDWEEQLLPLYLLDDVSPSYLVKDILAAACSGLPATFLTEQGMNHVNKMLAFLLPRCSDFKHFQEALMVRFVGHPIREWLICHRIVSFMVPQFLSHGFLLTEIAQLQFVKPIHVARKKRTRDIITKDNFPGLLRASLGRIVDEVAALGRRRWILAVRLTARPTPCSRR